MRPEWPPVLDDRALVQPRAVTEENPVPDLETSFHLLGRTHLLARMPATVVRRASFEDNLT
jgi:hypothetical protein